MAFQQQLLDLSVSFSQLKIRNPSTPLNFLCRLGDRSCHPAVCAMIHRSQVGNQHFVTCTRREEELKYETSVCGLTPALCYIKGETQ